MRGGRRARERGRELTADAGGGAGRGASAAWTADGGGPAAAAARRHRQRQDRGLPARAWPPRSSAAASAIVLVPEIALTPQTAGRFVERFGDTVAVLHSRLTAARALRRVGAAARRARRASASARARRCSRRSTDLGLIVVDEEHDASYKQEGDPRYDARHVAERRAGAGGRGAAGRHAPRRGRRACSATSASSCRERVDGRGAAAGRDGRDGRAWPGRCTQRTRDALEEVRRAGGEGDRAAQPPRLVELPHLRRVRAGLGVPALRRDAGAPPRGRARVLPPLRALASRCPAPAPTAARSRWPATGSAPSSSAPSSSG